MLLAAHGAHRRRRFPDEAADLTLGRLKSARRHGGEDETGASSLGAGRGGREEERRAGGGAGAAD